MVRLALSYSSGVSSMLQLLAQGLPGGVLVAAGHRVGKDREGDGSEAPEASECLPLVRRGRPPFVLEVLERADGGEDVSGLRLLAAGKRRM